MRFFLDTFSRDCRFKQIGWVVMLASFAVLPEAGAFPLDPNNPKHQCRLSYEGGQVFQEMTSVSCSRIETAARRRGNRTRRASPSNNRRVTCQVRGVVSNESGTPLRNCGILLRPLTREGTPIWSSNDGPPFLQWDSDFARLFSWTSAEGVVDFTVTTRRPKCFGLFSYVMNSDGIHDPFPVVSRPYCLD